MIRVIGVDPSLRATGVCLPNGQTFTIATGEAHRGAARLADLRKALTYYVAAQDADLAVVEVPTQFQSGDAALAAGMAQGIVRDVLFTAGVPFGLINPTKVKMFATGHGNADKAAMVHTATYYRDRLDNQAGHLAAIGDDNQADAWWLREMGLWARERRIDGTGDDILNGSVIRDAAVKESKGAKWPGNPRRTPRTKNHRATSTTPGTR